MDNGGHVAMVSLTGHQHGGSGGQGFDMGAHTDINKTLQLWSLPPAYVNGDNATSIGRSLASHTGYVGTTMYCITSCNTGNWTRMEAEGQQDPYGVPLISIPQKLANATGGYVLSTGGYASGQTALGNYSGLDPVHVNKFDPNGISYHQQQQVPNQLERNQQAYESEDGMYYLSFPSKHK
jgi:hypothetical protein